MKDVMTREVKGFVHDYQRSGKCRTSRTDPLLAFAVADDPLFRRLKEAVSPSHCLPDDLQPDARTVISYFIPFEKGMAKSNRRGSHASREWAMADACGQCSCLVPCSFQNPVHKLSNRAERRRP